MPTKSELQADRDRYYEWLTIARNERARGNFGKAIDRSLVAFPYIDGMMQFERKYEPRSDASRDHESIEAIDIVLDYSPYLFRFDAISSVRQLLDKQRRIDRNTTEDLRAKLASATRLMWELRKLWTELEQAGRLESSIALDALRIERAFLTKDALNPWHACGVLQHDPSRSYLELSTQMHAPWRGKCPKCGCVAKGPKRKLLEPVNCPKCKHSVTFTLISSASDGN